MLPRTIRCGGVSFDLERLLWVKKLILSAVTAVALVLGIGAAGASTSPYLEDKRDALLAAHNKARAAGGCAPLKRGPNIEDAALYHAKDMADENYTGHNSQNPFEYWYDRIDRYIDPPRYAGGENLAYGYSTVGGAMDGWRNSPSHWSNVMDCSFKYVGFGYAYSSSSTYKHYWVADFSY